ncbi:MAG: PAS domain S-box protein [Rhodospirillales bacterium]|nr:PAS domain S-box protein [Rhodospirillales bacterium]
MVRKSNAERHATISVILKYDLLRHEKLREAVESKLSENRLALGKSAPLIKQTFWGVLFTIFEDFLSGQTTLITDLHVETGFTKPTVRRRLQELVSMEVVTIRTDDEDRRCRMVSLTDAYKNIVDQFINDCSNEFRDLIHIHDRNEREAAMESLVESEERFRDLVEGSIQGTIISQNGIPVFANQEAANILAYATAQDVVAIPRTIEIAAPCERERVNGYRVARLRGEKAPKRYEYQGLRKDGSVIWIENQARVVSWKNEQAIQITFVDVTERKRAEKVLAESEARLRSIMENAPTPIFLRDIDGRLVDASKAYLDQQKKSRDQIVGTKASDYMEIELAEEIALQEKEVMESLEPRVFEVVHNFPDIGDRNLIVVRFPMIADDSELIGVGGISIDVTDRVIMERQLVQAQKMEVVGQLTRGVAHDFNNVLQVVETSLELAKDTIAEGSKAEELMNRALRAGHRGTTLTQQLLAFSRKQPLRPEPIDARSLVDGMTTLLARTLGEDISIETRFADGVANTIVDENGLTNALFNLALNARAAMPKGGALTVAVGQQHFDTDIGIDNDVLAAGDYVEIAITDTGCGMLAETLEHAFEPFFTTKEVGEGSGLGLSMVYGFVRQSGGNVTIESELGKGTTVRLVLPAATGEAISANGAQTARKGDQRAIKVLLVEDDADVRITTHMVLKSLGCEVVEAENAVPVPGILEQDDSIDLLLSDVVLPGGQNGVELAQEAVGQHPDLKVILISGYPEGTLVKAGLKEAGFRLLRKPFSKNALSEALGSVMVPVFPPES